MVDMNLVFTRNLFVIKMILIPPLWQVFIGIQRGADPLMVKAVLAFPSRSASNKGRARSHSISKMTLVLPS